MDIEILKCDTLEVLQNGDNTILQKWISSCREFRSHVAAKIEEKLSLEADNTKKKSINLEQTTGLQQEINAVESNINNIVPKLKVVDKKISNATKLQENIKTESDEMKAQLETLSLEVLDSQIKIEERKKKKVLTWDALKRACKLYKVNLDIHISLQEEKDCQNVKFSFFTHSKDMQDMYFVQLSCIQDHWKVEQIEPKIKEEHFNQLSSITDFPGYSKVSDIKLFLCQIRNVYLKYYMKTRKKKL
ncbi:uncharacterized protein LOC105181359 [Harpegnathos saltator]|uniref:Kinetochore protein SPC25 n=1 Tax=Harpegnathos saltator TaxID=610380 RepID=E2B3C9_HARSA|nr:uncharacterized protein LOC105181359 [Harpegnathos saltator]EFN89807.1 hypothetical protein EAI_13997 [Harpegnathos saltator]